MKMFAHLTRPIAMAAVAGLCLGLSAPSSQAYLGPTGYGEQYFILPAPGNIDPFKHILAQASLTIHKREIAIGQEADPANGLPLGEQGDVPGTGLQGVTYKVQRINFDVLDPKAWENPPQTVEEALALGFDSWRLGAGAEGLVFEDETDENGQLEIPGMRLGLYLVTETKVPNGVVGAAPFLVYLPMATPDGRDWNYDVHVYPKNSRVEAIKEVVDADKNKGDEITYTVRTPIPTLSEGQTLSKYVIRDDYDESRVDIDERAITLAVGQQEIPAEMYSVANSDGVITITFNNPGYLEGYAGQEVRTTIPAVMTGSGTIVNSAEAIVNNPSGGPDITLTTDEVKTYLGKVRVTKVDASDQSPLAGAKFSIYRAPLGEGASCASVDYEQDTPVSVGGTTEWITGQEGKIEIDGLHVTDVENHKDLINKAYCLYEVEAPAGFVLPEGENRYREFKLESAVAREGTDIGAEIIYETEVENVRQSGPNLPNTGGVGVGILALMGAAIFVAGAWFARRNSMRA